VPIYEYQCEEQGHRFEKWQSVQDEPVKTCPTCGSPVHKLFHPAGIIFKGSGWYVTDNRKASGTTESTGTHKPETKSDKTEAKSDAPAVEAKGTPEKKD
jgi:putative FmdB family regulatory protein